MKTFTPTPDEMQRNIARFSELQPKSRRYAEQAGIPAEAFEMIAAKRIYLLMAPQGAGGANASPAVVGEPGLTVNICECPPGNGPMLHAHERTRETFLCLRGHFEVRWGDEGEHRTSLGPLDLISVPPGVTRAFVNDGADTAWLLVMIQGTGEDLSDVAYSPQVGREIEDRYGVQVRRRFEEVLGWNFQAGVEA